MVIGITCLTVFLTGVNYNRSLSSNLYVSLGIIAMALFLFMAHGLYRGVGLIDNYPKYENFKGGNLLPNSGIWADLSGIDAGDGIGGLILSIVLWVVISILFIVLLLILEVIFWFSLFIILAMLYWLFFRALKFVFNKSAKTKGDIGSSIFYSLSYTTLYVGWIFGIIYLAEALS